MGWDVTEKGRGTRSTSAVRSASRPGRGDARRQPRPPCRAYNVGFVHRPGTDLRQTSILLSIVCSLLLSVEHFFITQGGSHVVYRHMVSGNFSFMLNFRIQLNSEDLDLEV